MATVTRFVVKTEQRITEGRELLIEAKTEKEARAIARQWLNPSERTPEELYALSNKVLSDETSEQWALAKPRIVEVVEQ